MVKDAVKENIALERKIMKPSLLLKRLMARRLCFSINDMYSVADNDLMTSFL